MTALCILVGLGAGALSPPPPTGRTGEPFGAGSPSIVLFVAGPSAGWDTSEPSSAPAMNLGEAVEEVARAWGQGSVDSLTQLFSSAGVVLHLHRETNTPLPPRQARAALRDFLRGYETAEIRVIRVSEAGGEPAKGYGELHWAAVPAGTSQPVELAIFVGFLQEEGRWRVSEVRLLR